MTVTFNHEAFDLCARKSLEHAVARLEVEAAAQRSLYEKYGARGNLMLAISDENAACTLRELLRYPEGAYGEESP